MLGKHMRGCKNHRHAPLTNKSRIGLPVGLLAQKRWNLMKNTSSCPPGEWNKNRFTRWFACKRQRQTNKAIVVTSFWKMKEESIYSGLRARDRCKGIKPRRPEDVLYFDLSFEKPFFKIIKKNHRHVCGCVGGTCTSLRCHSRHHHWFNAAVLVARSHIFRMSGAVTVRCSHGHKSPNHLHIHHHAVTHHRHRSLRQFDYICCTCVPVRNHPCHCPNTTTEILVLELGHTR